MRVAIDPGHGMGNRTARVFDPGAVAGAVREADIALAVGLFLHDECVRRGWPAMMTRSTNGQEAPLSGRVPAARAFGADVLVSLHCNAHSGAQAHGTETLYLASEWVARAVQRRLIAALGTRDRGVKQRSDLAVLRYDRPAVLCELAFISNPDDRALLLDEGVQRAAARAIAAGLDEAIRA